MVRRKVSDDRSISRLIWGLGAFGALMFCSLVFGGQGIRHMFGLQAWLDDLSLQTYTRIVRNADLRNQVDALRTDDRALEEVARSTLGVVRDNEIVYVFPTSAQDRR